MFQILIEGLEITFGPRAPPPPPAGKCYSYPAFPKEVSLFFVRVFSGSKKSMINPWCFADTYTADFDALFGADR